MALQTFGNTPGEDPEKTSKAMRQFTGPHAIDYMMRQALMTCWMLLPEGQKNAQALKSELQRILDRAIANFQEDATAFGYDSPPPK